jgi:hypothetical protein
MRALMASSTHVLRAGRPRKIRAGMNSSEPMNMPHQVAMYFAPACLRIRFQAVCRMAEPNRSPMAPRDMEFQISDLRLTIVERGLMIDDC